LAASIDTVSLLSETGIFESKGAARKMIQNGGVSINRSKVADPQQMINSSLLLHNKYLLVQVGKKNYFLLIAED
jgi:tyrosyl-tRNA synthetase